MRTPAIIIGIFLFLPVVDAAARQPRGRAIPGLESAAPQAATPGTPSSPTPAETGGERAGDTEAEAAESTRTDPGPGMAVLLGPVRWGQSAAQVMKAFEGELWDEYNRERRRMHNAGDIDRLRASVQRQIQAMRSRYVELTRDSTEYHASILDGEFRRGTGEAILRLDDEDSQRYYLFIKDRLWKMVQVANPSESPQAGFESTVRKLSTEYGVPADRDSELDRRSRRQVLKEVIWRDHASELKVTNQPLLATHSIILTDQETEKRITHLRGSDGSDSPNRGPRSLSETLMDTATTGSGDAASPDIVDQLIRKKSTHPAENNDKDAHQN